MAEKPKVGDKVIYCKRGERPIETTVVRVAAAGWLKVALDDPHIASLAFKPSKYYYFYRPSGATLANHEVHLWSEEIWKQLMNRAEEKEHQRAKDKAEKERKETECQAQYDAEMTETKENLSHNLNVWTSQRGRLSNGDRVVWLDLPVKPCLVERKGTVEIVIARLTDQDHYDEVGRDCKMMKQVALYITFANANISSFASCSPSYHNSDEEALWEAARRCYHS